MKTTKTKRIIAAILGAIIGITGAMILASCNKNIGIGNYKFTKVHIFTSEGKGECYELSSWREAEIGVEVRTKEYGSLWLSEGCYILCEDKCPICDKEK